MILLKTTIREIRPGVLQVETEGGHVGAGSTRREGDLAEQIAKAIGDASPAGGRTLFDSGASIVRQPCTCGQGLREVDPDCLLHGASVEKGAE